jgi:putative SOS response-associated peptidase YedK
MYLSFLKVHFMCYSISSTSKVIDLEKRYGKKTAKSTKIEPVFFASAFTFPMWPIVTKSDTIQWMQWGLVPVWFKGGNLTDFAKHTLNARVETLDEKSAYKHVINQKRCLIPATGFFEWKTIGKEKIPYLIQLKDKTLFSFAGIYDEWVNPIDGKALHSFSIITCEANELMAEIHNTKKRMPIILNDETGMEWISENPFTIVKNLLLPYDSDAMNAHEINKSIILSKEPNQAKILEPFTNTIFTQGSLF